MQLEQHISRTVVDDYGLTDVVEACSTYSPSMSLTNIFSSDILQSS